MCEAICEEVSGSDNIVILRRCMDFDAVLGSPLPIREQPPWSVHSPGCYKFRCSCVIGKKRGWVGNRDWSFNKFDREKYCNHLFIVLTIYEHERKKQLGMLIYNNIHKNDIMAYNLANSATLDGQRFSYRLLEDKFNGPRRGWREQIKLYDKSNINKYTVKCSAARDPVWECTCKGYKFRGCCKHINYVKNNEMYKQYRRELGLSLIHI